MLTLSVYATITPQLFSPRRRLPRKDDIDYATTYGTTITLIELFLPLLLLFFSPLA